MGVKYPSPSSGGGYFADNQAIKYYLRNIYTITNY